MKRILTILLLGALAALGIAAGSRAAWTALILILLLVLLELIWHLRVRRRITLKIEVKSAGRSASASAVFENPCALPLPALRAALTVENTYTGQKRRQKLRLALPAGKTNEISLTAADEYCGKVRISIDSVRLEDLFGLIPVKVPVAESGYFTLLPELFDMTVSYDARESSSFDNELYSPYRRGQDRSEVFQIREYEPGDHLGSIHWKLSEKTDKLMVKEASLPMDKSLILVMDKSAGEPVPLSVGEALAELTVSLGWSLIDAGITYRLIWNDPETDLLEEREIQFEEEFTEAIPSFLTGRIAPGASASDLLVRLNEARKATHVLYLAAQEPEIDDLAFPDALICTLDASRPDYREQYAFLSLI